MKRILKNLTHVPAVSSKPWGRWYMSKAVLSLAIPLVIAELGSVAQQFADTMMVGHYGTEELAAAGFANSIFLYVIFLSLGMSYASTPLIGSAFGRKDYKSVFIILRESIIVNLIWGLAFVALLTLLYHNLESLFFQSNSILFFKINGHHQPQEILELSKDYLKYLIASVPFLTLFFACKQYLDGIGTPQKSMWIMLFANVLNIVLNWCLIYGHFGLPQMGLRGAGLSTLISRIVQLVLVLYCVYKSKTVKKNLYKFFQKEFRPTKEGIKQQFRLGFPVSIQLGLEIGMFNICGIFAGWLGAIPLAAHQAMYTLSTLWFQILYGIGSAGAILISQFHGLYAWRNIRKVASTSFIIGIISNFAISLVVYFCFNDVAQWFTNDPNVVKVMLAILPSLLFYQIGDCLQITYGNALRGIEKTRPIAFIAIFSYIVVAIPLCYYLTFGRDWGVHGVWMGIPIGLTLAGILFYGAFVKNVKRHSC